MTSTDRPDRPDLAKQILVLAGDLAKLTTAVKTAESNAALRASGTEGRLEQIEAALREQADLSGQIRELKEAIDELSAAAAEPTVWDWTTMNTAAAEGTWATLADWVSDIAFRQLGLLGWHRNLPGKFGQKHTQLPPCWAMHRDVIWIVSWACQEWLRVWQTSAGTPAKQGDWYTRLWPGLLARLNVSSAAGCLDHCQWADDGYGWGIEGDALEAATAKYRATLGEQLRRAYAQQQQRKHQAQSTAAASRAAATPGQPSAPGASQYRPTRVEPRDFTR